MYPIGTRVRIVASRFPSEIGKEGRIVNIDLNAPENCIYLTDIVGPDGLTGWWSKHESVEPITYDGNTKTQWSDCGIWRPNQEKVP